MHRSIRLLSQRGHISHSTWWERFEAAWNERTGVAEMAQLKQSVQASSAKLELAMKELSNARTRLDRTWNETLQLQREHSDLLRHRDRWTPEEANRFATLVQHEVTLRNDFNAAKEYSRNAETNVSQAQLEYMDQLRRRYHEETVWQDKWRILGTYGTWTLIGLNSIVFGASQFLYQRRELERVKHMEALLDQRLPKTTMTDPQGQQEEESEPTKCSGQEETSVNQHQHEDESDAAKPIDEDNEESTRFWSQTRKRLLHTKWASSNLVLDYIQQHQYFTLHIPSAALGATITTLVFLLAQNRRQ